MQSEVCVKLQDGEQWDRTENEFLIFSIAENKALSFRNTRSHPEAAQHNQYVSANVFVLRENNWERRIKGKHLSKGLKSIWFQTSKQFNTKGSRRGQ